MWKNNCPIGNCTKKKWTPQLTTYDRARSFFIAFEVWPKKIDRIQHILNANRGSCSFVHEFTIIVVVFCSHRRLVIVNCSRHPPRFSAIIVRLVFSVFSRLFEYYKNWAVKYEFYECFNAFHDAHKIYYFFVLKYLFKKVVELFVCGRTMEKSCLTLFIFIDQ